ncbi:MAG: endonuclease/exonuclease/phosphatase family protein [Anaerolineae bacterium]
MLRIMSLNLNYDGDRHGPWSERRKTIAREIASAQPDIIALQAVYKAPDDYYGVDQATQLAALIPSPIYRHIYFQPAVNTPDGGAAGSAILSRIPFVDIHYTPLTLIPDLEDTNRRVLLTATFDFRFTPFYLFNGHFSWVSAQAEMNVKEVLPTIDVHRRPALLIGDLSQTPGSPAMQRLAREDWADIWAMLCSQKNGYTFEAGNLSKRIDYAWANFELKPRVRSIELIGDNPSPGAPHLSDHLGLMVTLDLMS